VSLDEFCRAKIKGFEIRRHYVKAAGTERSSVRIA